MRIARWVQGAAVVAFMLCLEGLRGAGRAGDWGHGGISEAPPLAKALFAGMAGSVILGVLAWLYERRAAGDLSAASIFGAARKGSAGRLRALLENGADVNARRPDDGYTALHLAAAGGHTEAANLLIRRGADADAADNLGFTPLHLAAAGKHSGMVELLLSAHADANARDVTGCAPLHRAAGAGCLEAVRMLLDHGADPGARGKGGETLLLFVPPDARDALRALAAERGIALPEATEEGARALALQNAFAVRMARQNRVWLVLGGVIALTLVCAGIFFVRGDEGIPGIPLQHIVWVCVGAVPAAVLYSRWNWRCPACRKYMGDVTSGCCPRCGVRLAYAADPAPAEAAGLAGAARLPEWEKTPERIKQEFGRRMKRQRALTLCAVAGILVLMVGTGGPVHLPQAAVVAVGAVTVLCLAAATWDSCRNCRCPACGAHIEAWAFPRLCPRCKAQLRD